MIKNTLTNIEFEKFFLAILQLKNVIIIKEIAYKTFHFKDCAPTDPSQYIISVEKTGVKTYFKGFEVEIKRLDDPIGGYSGVILVFKRQNSFLELFFNTSRQLIRALKSYCYKEILDFRFQELIPYGFEKNGIKQQFEYHKAALNPSWKETGKLSPLTIYSKKDSNSTLVEFIFIPFCYKRIADKTVLKENWHDILINYTHEI